MYTGGQLMDNPRTGRPAFIKPCWVIDRLGEDFCILCQSHVTITHLDCKLHRKMIKAMIAEGHGKWFESPVPPDCKWTAWTVHRELIEAIIAEASIYHCPWVDPLAPPRSGIPQDVEVDEADVPRSSTDVQRLPHTFPQVVEVDEAYQEAEQEGPAQEAEQEGPLQEAEQEGPAQEAEQEAEQDGPAQEAEQEGSQEEAPEFVMTPMGRIFMFTHRYLAGVEVDEADVPRLPHILPQDVEVD